MERRSVAVISAASYFLLLERSEEPASLGQSPFHFNATNSQGLFPAEEWITPVVVEPGFDGFISSSSATRIGQKPRR